MLGMVRHWWGLLRRPSTRWSVLTLLVVGIVLGSVGVVGFNLSLHATNTEAFCTSCHEMYAQPFQTVQQTTHYNNASGVRPTCSDCHVPHEFVPKMIRKIEAAREVWGSITGMIDTPEKYMAHLEQMKAREIARMRSNDSAGCRSCHDVARMDFSAQGEKARFYHSAMAEQGKTCIDCHQGIAHQYPGTVPASGQEPLAEVAAEH
ncbi:NapC/NirT family cytochrome c [Ketobacter sp.]|uniref:NapC/NirT family cytochrome c n=1 Tax=Ketobacter sp. TaxID=2083498 RepID=UPI000F201E0F|nr:NapC/NirT family cytochrome c [Ketobacter sp.]RLU00692.1 MAG: hypothetical protein D9N14_05340 [Ketobacter sp.]